MGGGFSTGVEVVVLGRAKTGFFSGMDISALERRALRRGGVLTRVDLDAAGLSSGAIGRAVRAGRLRVVRHGVLTTSDFLDGVAGDAWARHALEVRAALAMADDVSVAGEASAAALHGMAMFGRPPKRPILTRPVELSRKAGGHRSTVARVARLAEREVVRVGGWWATGVGRTVVDVARRRGERCAVVAGDWALGNGLTGDELTWALADGARAPGIRRAREYVARCDARAESPLESLARLAILQAGLPMPVAQFEIGQFRVDFCWPDRWLVLEVDGRGKYSSPDDLFAEKRREDWIRAKGYQVVRADWDDVVPDARRLCAGLAARLRAQAA